MKLFFYKKLWVLLLLVQVGTILYFIRDSSQYGIYNTDAFSYHVQWSKVASTLNPFSEAILADPGHDLVRVPFSLPHFFVGVTAHFFNPVTAYIIWCCIGVLMAYFSLLFFARALGFKEHHARIIALVHYTFFHLLSQLPPLSRNQLQYIVDWLTLKPEYMEHVGPLQYPHDIFFYPLLYCLLALTLFGVRKIKAGETINVKYVLLWGGLCLLLPVNYFYHWFQFAFALGFVVASGFVFRWWSLHDIRKYSAVSVILCVVLAGWGGVVLFQNSQLADQEGYRFALMGGLTEARFFLLPQGLLLRIVLWSIVALLVLRIKDDSVLLVGFLIGCVVLMNMQIVVGKNIQPGHWSFGVDRVFGWIAILVIAEVLKKYGRTWMSKLVPVTIAITIIFFTAQTFVSWKYFENLSRWDDDRTEVITFLKSQPVSVVLAPELWIETDILIHTKHYSFLPRGAQSAVSAEEQLQRMSHAAFMLGYSREGFLKWVHTRSVRFFGMLYATEKEFSSTYFYDPARQKEVVAFRTGALPSWDWTIIEEYTTSDLMLAKQLDLIVLHSNEAKPTSAGAEIFRNNQFVVYTASSLKAKVWGEASPSEEKRYNSEE